METRRTGQICTECGIEIYLNHSFFYQCPVHGEFTLNYRTGLLEKVKKAKKNETDMFPHNPT